MGNAELFTVRAGGVATAGFTWVNKKLIILKCGNN